MYHSLVFREIKEVRCTVLEKVSREIQMVKELQPV